MMMNLSKETMQTVYNALKEAELRLKRKIYKEDLKPTRRDILEHQLNEVLEAMHPFEEALYCE